MRSVTVAAVGEYFSDVSRASRFICLATTCFKAATTSHRDHTVLVIVMKTQTRLFEQVLVLHHRPHFLSIRSTAIHHALKRHSSSVLRPQMKSL